MSRNLVQKSKYLPSKYDRRFYLTKCEKSKRFYELKPLVVHVLFGERKTFDYVRNVALASLEKTILDQLELLALGDVYDYNHLEDLSKSMFHWGKKDFYKRRNIKKTIWIEILRRESSKKLLEGLKILTDLGEIKKWIKTVFNVFRDAKEEIDSKVIEKLIWQPMGEVEHYLNILDILHDENSHLINIYKDIRYAFNSRLFNRRQTERQLLLRQREEDLLNIQATEPIEIRYLINWYRGKADHVQVGKFVKQKSIESNLNKEEIRMDLEDMCNNSICDFYYSLTDQFKTQIVAFQRRYDTEVEAIDNDINYTRIQMKKLQDTKQFLTNEIARFREEIKEIVEKEEEAHREAEEKERLRLEEEAFLESERLRLEKLKAKKLKKAQGKAKTKK